MRRRAFLGAASAALATPALRARAADPIRVSLGVGGKPVLYYLPLTVAERLGLFSEQGLAVEISDFAGGAKALQALIGGSVAVVTGAYEHTIRMQAKGQDVRGVCELGRLPGIVVAVRKDRAAAIPSVAALKGAKIGVSAPGSSTMLTAQYAMVKAGLRPTDAAFIGTGASAGAVAALHRGEIDAISNADPIITRLQGEDAIVPLVDTRTEAGTRALFGGTNPAAVLYARAEFIDRNQPTMQKLVDALRKALNWMETATPAAIADLVPPEYHLGDRALYVRSVENSRECYSRSGRPEAAGMRSVLDMVRTLDPEIAGAPIDLAATFDARFLRTGA